MPTHQCSGYVTFNEIHDSAFSEWPDNLPGYICKAPPVGPESAPRLAQCCSGTVYNITSPTSRDHPAYPVSCATLCQVDPAFDKSNDDNPYGWSDFFMCLTDGGQPDPGSVVCGTVTVKGEPAPTSFSSTPSGSWMTDWTSYWTYDVHPDDLFPTFWIPMSDYVPEAEGTGTATSSDNIVSMSTTPGPSETGQSSTSPSEPPSASTPTSSSVDATVATPTGAACRSVFALGRTAAALLVVSTLCVGWRPL
ncbi:uncharacterized protein BJX67DRAFT_225250 [Aspergillus lucknowensis]|uniref:Uncharacterized protein n=1 Tax=Aspergillus lucknowensis TaxID=176173 RepID=A0ABR4LIA8_9EURO